MKTFKEYLFESTPPGKDAEDWVKKNKEEFKQRYGDDYEKYLYGKAWDLFGDSIKTIDLELKSFLNEDADATTTTAGVAEPEYPLSFNKSKFMGHPCIEVDDDTYSKMIQGKQKFSRWSNYVEDEDLKGAMKDMYNTNNRMLIKNSKTGGMVFIK